MSQQISNSILFDIDSIIDIEISVVRFIAGAYKDYESLDNFDLHKIRSLSIEDMKFHRIYSPRGLFREVATNKDIENVYTYRPILQALYNANEDEILSKYVFTTNILSVIDTCRKTGNGIIKCTIRCDNEKQKEFVQKLVLDSVRVIVCAREDVVTSSYARIMSGSALDVMKYKIKPPKNIAILNFRENFSPKDITLLSPELVINLGTINQIDVVSAYVEEDNDDIEIKG